MCVNIQLNVSRSGDYNSRSVKRWRRKAECVCDEKLRNVLEGARYLFGILLDVEAILRLYQEKARQYAIRARF